MSPLRVLLLVVVPVLLINLLTGKYGKLLFIDTLVLLHIFWIILTVTIHHPNLAIQYAGSNTILILGGYLVGRASIRNIEDFRSLSRTIAGAVLISLPFALAEARTGIMYIPRLLDNIPGITSAADVLYIPRMGLHRVQFVFVHPIHYGLFCSIAASFVFLGLKGTMSTASRMILTAVALLCCFLSVSSGPFLSVLVQIFLIVWLSAMRNVKKKWRLLGIILLVMYLMAEVASNRPAIFAIVSRLSFSASTANVRMVLFDYGVAQIIRTPILGVGFRDFGLPTWMTGSIDNFWLLQAVIFGMPTLIFLATAIILAIRGVFKTDASGNQAFESARYAWSFTMVSLALTLATVAIWGGMLTVFYLIFASGIWMMYGDHAERTAEPPLQGSPHTHATRHTRFAEKKSRPGLNAVPDSEKVLVD